MIVIEYTWALNEAYIVHAEKMIHISTVLYKYIVT